MIEDFNEDSTIVPRAILLPLRRTTMKNQKNDVFSKVKL
jgi:hypothetical protein